jgi:hypothetical protein
VGSIVRVRLIWTRRVVVWMVATIAMDDGDSWGTVTIVVTGTNMGIVNAITTGGRELSFWSFLLVQAQTIATTCVTCKLILCISTICIKAESFYLLLDHAHRLQSASSVDYRGSVHDTELIL